MVGEKAGTVELSYSFYLNCTREQQDILDRINNLNGRRQQLQRTIIERSPKTFGVVSDYHASLEDIDAEFLPWRRSDNTSDLKEVVQLAVDTGLDTVNVIAAQAQELDVRKTDTAARARVFERLYRSAILRAGGPVTFAEHLFLIQYGTSRRT